MYVHVNVVVPKKLTKRQRELLEQLAEELGEDVADERTPAAEAPRRLQLAGQAMSLQHFYLARPGARRRGRRRPFPLRLVGRTTRSTRACSGWRRASASRWWTPPTTTSRARSPPSTTRSRSCASRSASSDADAAPSVDARAGPGQGRQDGDGHPPRHRAGRGGVRVRWRASAPSCGSTRGRPRRRPQRWRAIAKSAAMQSGQPRCVPTCASRRRLRGGVRAARRTRTAAARCAGRRLRWRVAASTSALDRAPPAAAARGARAPAWPWSWAPKGGLAPSARRRRCWPATPAPSLVSLGPSILRTETAGIVAPALALYELERRARAGAL